MLEVADRIDADGKRDLPRCLRKRLDGGERVCREGTAVLRLKNEQEIIVLCIGSLQVLESDQLGILVGEKYPVVVRKLEILSAGTDAYSADDGS